MNAKRINGGRRENLGVRLMIKETGAGFEHSRSLLEHWKFILNRTRL